ncbi:hypothetical protein DFH08DRAFT_938169 [Mycena albidolilacea]|uniref:DUF6589 domain-containing protein n=1 Tax=Mycena albidolilacea TaxID=1033008 RepID=A0AAD7ENF2_9AGAR|nr:hypothetical protein DFH08DRAFT_938169 [Mycena albidolilacea]
MADSSPIQHIQYPLRVHQHVELGSDDFAAEGDAESSEIFSSAPNTPIQHPVFGPAIAFGQLDPFFLADGEDEDSTFGESTRQRVEHKSNLDKAKQVLNYMDSELKRFTFCNPLDIFLTSDDEFMTHRQSGITPDISNWIVAVAADICNYEASHLTDRASSGPYYKDAKLLHVPAKVTNLQNLHKFSIPRLLSIYERTLPALQTILKGVIRAKKLPTDKDVERITRNPDMGCTMVTSTLLNFRSREMNLHQAMNSLILWQADTSKPVIKHQMAAVHSVARDGVQLVRLAANNPDNLLLLPNDNFNWVSALLVVLDLPPGTNPEIASVANFERTLGTRHQIPAEQSLEEIMPTAADQNSFFQNTITHVAHILAEEMPLQSHQPKVPSSTCPHDQEQTSTRGNVLVMEHYFRDVLQIPAANFETRNYFLLGDRLTTAREHAAQDQRLNIGKNAWGGADRDTVSLETCIKKLPNCESINVRKIDFYAWLRFLDVVLCALVLQAAIVILRLPSPEALDTCNLDDNAFCKLCTHIATQFVMPSFDRLEAEGIKRLPGSTQNGNAVLLMHDLMSVQEMRQSIKFGHPERMQRMLKFWTPMFYTGGSYNYANEGMELLHNLVHDWPSEISNILCAGMFINTQGKPSTFKETDIRVEHFNKVVKSHTDGVNAAPGALEKIVPVIGHIQELHEQVFEDLGINDHDHYHSKVAQHKDV